MNQALLMSLIDYDPDTGLFKWRFYARNHKEGWFAGAENLNGYLTIRMQNKTYYAHVLAYIYVNGFEPWLVDHINRNRADNRIVNLRAADRSQSAINSKTRSDNTSGHPGVSLHTNGRWVGYINIVNKGRVRKYFGTREEAIVWRKAKETELYGAFVPATEEP